MSSASQFSHLFKRRTLVCSDCRRWLAETSIGQQRRHITRNHLHRIKVAENEWQERKDAIDDGQAKSLLEKLEERGLVNQIVGTRDELNKVLVERRVGVYCGVDPTAASLHIGHMVPFMALGWMYIHGYASTFLLGGFTASIGDPTDRLNARPEQKTQERKANMISMFDQLKRLAASMEKYAERRGYHREWAWRRSVRNNNEWWSKVTVDEYMKRLGRYMRIGPMLGRDSVKNRLEKGDGMSYAEFSYPLIQGWDWWHQFQTGTQLQIGGADQFGNILAGADAVKAMAREHTEFQQKYTADLKGFTASGDPMGFTVPLLTTSSGEKFGKSAGNAVWIDRQLTSSFDLYQFFLRSSDDDVERYLKMLTFLPMNQIRETMKEHQMDESKRVAQHKLAFEFVELVHGLVQAREAEEMHRQAFSKDLTVDQIKSQMRSEETPSQNGRPADLHPSLNKHAQPLNLDASYNVNIKLPQSLVIQQPLSRILWSSGLVASRSEGQRLINNKGVYIGGRIGPDGQPARMRDTVSYIPVEDHKWSFVEPLIVDGNLIVLRVGKWKKKFIEIVPDAEYEASGETCPGWQDEIETASDPLTKADIAGEEMYRKSGQEKQASEAQREMSFKSRQSGGFGQVTRASLRKN